MWEDKLHHEAHLITNASGTEDHSTKRSGNVHVHEARVLLRVETRIMASEGVLRNNRLGPMRRHGRARYCWAQFDIWNLQNLSRFAVE